jgi:hypothetical protein
MDTKLGRAACSWEWGNLVGICAAVALFLYCTAIIVHGAAAWYEIKGRAIRKILP